MKYAGTVTDVRYWEAVEELPYTDKTWLKGARGFNDLSSERGVWEYIKRNRCHVEDDIRWAKQRRGK